MSTTDTRGTMRLFVVAGTVDLPAGTTAACTIVGMAAFFTASVQAPIIGLILATEMTNTVNWLPPMLGAVALAMLVARMLDTTPIYDALAERSAHNAEINATEVAASAGGERST